MAAVMSWFRFWNQAIHHPKIAPLSDQEFRILVTLWSLASQSSRPGTIKKADHKVLQTLSHIEEDGAPHGFAVVEALDRYEELGLVTRLNGDIEVHDWKHWQRRSDATNAKRQKKFRERYVTLRNGVEKRREEKRRMGGSGSLEPSPTTKKIVRNDECPERLRGLELILSESQCLTHHTLRDWSWWDTLYKSVLDCDLDFPTILAEMDAWLMENPHRAPASRWKAFAGGWIRRNANRIRERRRQLERQSAQQPVRP